MDVVLLGLLFILGLILIVVGCSSDSFLEYLKSRLKSCPKPHIRKPRIKLKPPLHNIKNSLKRLFEPFLLVCRLRFEFKIPNFAKPFTIIKTKFKAIKTKLRAIIQKIAPGRQKHICPKCKKRMPRNNYLNCPHCHVLLKRPGKNSSSNYKTTAAIAESRMFYFRIGAVIFILHIMAGHLIIFGNTHALPFKNLTYLETMLLLYFSIIFPANIVLYLHSCGILRKSFDFLKKLTAKYFSYIKPHLTNLRARKRGEKL